MAAAGADTRLAEQKRDARNIEVFGRLADQVTVPQAQSEMNTIAGTLARDYPETNKDFTTRVMTFNDRSNGGPIRVIFLSLMGAVAFVLLIACANVANLLLARSASRAREMSVRVSLGASRWRIVRQLLVESVLLSVVSGLLGLALAYVGVRMFDAVTQDVGKPYWIKFTMDAQVFAFFAAVCLGTGILFGLAPALHVSKTDLNEVLKEGGRSGSSGIRARRWTSVLIVAELALTLVLLDWRRIDDAQFSHALSPRRRRRDVASADDAPGAAGAEVQHPRGPPDILRTASTSGSRASAASRPPRSRRTCRSAAAARRLLAIDGRPLTAGEQPQTVTADHHRARAISRPWACGCFAAGRSTRSMGRRPRRCHRQPAIRRHALRRRRSDRPPHQADAGRPGAARHGRRRSG